MDGERDDLVIRSLTLDDCQRLVRIDEQITGRSRKAWFEGKLKRALRDSDVQVSLGATRDGLLVGAMLASLHYGEFGLPEPTAVLDTVLVDRSFSRQGIASALFDQLVKNLQGLRIERLRTEVAWNDHELVVFFSRKGFNPVPRIVLEAELA
jgi:ribosomal protein S18 acetylase RimI-like enzyme